MYIVNITKYNTKNEFVLEDEPNNYIIEDLVEAHFVSMKDAAEFYTNRENYIADVEIVFEEHGYPRIWEFQTGETGWDTYDSGVFIAWTEKRARELAEKISRDFLNADVTCIGTANQITEEGVCSSFNAG